MTPPASRRYTSPRTGAPNRSPASPGPRLSSFWRQSQLLYMGPMLSGSTVVVRCSEPLQAEVGEEIVIFSAQQGSYHAFGASGSRIWELLGEPITVSSLCGTLTSEYDVDEQRCLREVSSFLEELRQAELIEVRPD